MIKTVLLITVLAVGQLGEVAKQAFNNAEKQILGRNVVVKPVGKCPCGGKGYIIQGDGHRTDCPGTDDGKPCPYRRARDAGSQALPADHGTITMFSGPSCSWCQKWKKEILPAVVPKRWKVKERNGAPGRSIPYFEISLYGKTYYHNGFMSVAQLNAILAKAKAEHEAAQ